MDVVVVDKVVEEVNKKLFKEYNGFLFFYFTKLSYKKLGWRWSWMWWWPRWSTRRSTR